VQRRGFLKLFGAASVATVAGVVVLDPEALLWRPGARLISIPAAQRVREFLHGFYTATAVPGSFSISELQDPDRWIDAGGIRLIKHADEREVLEMVRWQFIMDAPVVLSTEREEANAKLWALHQLIQPCGPRS
jgi:hypothetical protein